MKKLMAAMMALFVMAQVGAAEGDWLTDIDKAKEKAKKENKLILMDFTGSDWCPPCKALSSRVFGSKAFKEYADKNLVLMEVDFPNRKEQSAALKAANNKLKDQFKIEGFPTIILLTPEGKEVWRGVGYGGEPANEYIAKLKAKKAS